MNGTGIAPLGVAAIFFFLAFVCTWRINPKPRREDILTQEYLGCLGVINFAGGIFCLGIFIWAALFSSYGVIP